MGWLQNYCGTEQPSVFSPDVPLAFSPCFSASVLQCADIPLFAIVTVILLCQHGSKSRVAFRPPALPALQRLLLAFLTSLPLLLLIASGSSAAPFRVTSLLLRCLTFASVLILLYIHVNPSRYAQLHVVSTRMVRWLQAEILLSTVGTAMQAYGMVVTVMATKRVGAEEVLSLLTVILHTALALTAVSALIALSARRTAAAAAHVGLQRGLLLSEPLVSSTSSFLYDADEEDDELLEADSSHDAERGCLSSFTFSWVGATIRLGRAQGFLHLSDIPPLPAADSTADIAQRFSLIWQQERLRPSPSLLRAFYALIGPAYFLLGLLKFCSDLTVFIGPVLLSFFVTFLSSQAQPSSASPAEPAERGYLYALGLVGGVLLSSVLGTQYTYRSRLLSMRVRSAIVSVVYRKSLTVSGLAQRRYGSGRVVNVMSVDTERVMDVCTSFHDFWSLPVQIGVALYLLHAQVGIALLAGLAVVLLLIPVNAALTKKIAAVSRSMMRWKDRRVQLTNEMLHHIRSIKAMALEPRFDRRIRSVRGREMQQLTARKYLDALCVYFWATTPILVSLATFALYALLGGQLTASRVFTSLALLNTLIRPLNSFPWVINGLVEGRVSALRVKDFLLADDRDEQSTLQPTPEEEKDGSVVIDLQGSFSYQRMERNSGVVLDGQPQRGDKPNGRSAMDSAADGDEQWLPLDRDTASPQRPAPPRLSSTGSVNGTHAFSVKARQARPSLFHLEDVAVRVRKGDFVGVCGTVGSGKSSLLLAMLGELWGMKTARLPPHTFIEGRIAYVAQEAWIQNTTLRENVLFGLPYEQQRYDAVMEAVALLPDMKQLPAGDLTEIGEGGINLSGGQKVRVSIARAAYADCDVYLLDDILSAVDVHVGHHLMRRLVCGLLASKTRVLITHHTHFLRAASCIIQMSAGRIVNIFMSHAANSGERGQLQLAAEEEKEDLPALPPQAELPSPSLAQQLKKRQEEREEEEDRARLTVDESRERGVIRRRVLRVYLAQVGVALTALIFLGMLLMQASRNYSDWYLGQWAADTAAASAGNTSTSSSVYLASSSLSSPLLLPPLFPAVSMQHVRSAVSTPQIGSDSSSLSHLRVLAVIAGFNSLAALFRAFIFAYGGLKAARLMFDRLLARVLYARVAFFDQNPVGRILNRFSTDQYSIDENIPFQGNIFLAQTFLLCGALLIIAITTPLFLLLVPPLAAVYVYVQRQYRTTSRELRRLDSVTRSPLYSTFTETLSGILTIRAFAAAARFHSAFITLLDTNQRLFFLSLAASQWLNVRLQLIGLFIIAFLAFSAVVLALYVQQLPSSLSSLPFLNVSLVGLAIAYALPLTDTLNGLIGSFTDTEKEIVSVERAVEYLNIPTERDEDDGQQDEQQEEEDSRPEETSATTAPAADLLTPRVVKRVRHLSRHEYLEETLLPFHSASSRPLIGAAAMAKSVAGVSPAWPSAGAVNFDNVTLVYRRGLAPALSRVSFSIPARGHIGVVGRTGAGKSSLFQVLLRMREISGGRVLVDGADIREVPLPVLRRGLCLIPQSPVLFTGSVRDNVDLFGQHSDAQVWAVLEHCQMADKVRTLPRGLRTRLSEQAEHFSLGQRQLLCFGRALLQQARVIMLDEASASLDAVSDAQIQRLTAGLKEATVIVIAHRISTVLSMDKVMVIEQAKLVEYDAPHALLQRQGGFFRRLVEQSDGKADALT